MAAGERDDAVAEASPPMTGRNASQSTAGLTPDLPDSAFLETHRTGRKRSKRSREDGTDAATDLLEEEETKGGGKRPRKGSTSVTSSGGKDELEVIRKYKEELSRVLCETARGAEWETAEQLRHEQMSP